MSSIRPRAAFRPSGQRSAAMRLIHRWAAPRSRAAGRPGTCWRKSALAPPRSRICSPPARQWRPEGRRVDQFRVLIETISSITDRQPRGPEKSKKQDWSRINNQINQSKIQPGRNIMPRITAVPNGASSNDDLDQQGYLRSLIIKRGSFALATLLMVTVLATSSSMAVAQEIKERTIRFGYAWDAGHPIGLAAKRFGEIVTAKSGGKFKFRDFPSNQLGPEAQQQSALVGGTQQMLATASAQIAGVVKEFGILDFPFIVATEQQADALNDGPAGQALLDMLPAKNLIGLGYWENRFRHVTNSKRPVTRLEDLSGLKMRVRPVQCLSKRLRHWGRTRSPCRSQSCTRHWKQERRCAGKSFAEHPYKQPV